MATCHCGRKFKSRVMAQAVLAQGRQEEEEKRGKKTCYYSRRWSCIMQGCKTKACAVLAFMSGAIGACQRGMQLRGTAGGDAARCPAHFMFSLLAELLRSLCSADGVGNCYHMRARLICLPLHH